MDKVARERSCARRRDWGHLRRANVLTQSSKRSLNLKLDLSLRIQRLRAYLLGDLSAAVALFDRDMVQACVDGKAPAEAVRGARKTASLGVGGAGIGATGFLLFCAIESRIAAPRWPTASLVWFALWASAALLFAWHYYAVTGAMGWRRAWYRVTGDPRMHDAPLDRVPPQLGRQLVIWKLAARLAGFLGATLLLAGMAALRWAPMSWDTWWFWVSACLVFAAVYWPIDPALKQCHAAYLTNGS
jgi:hypothetical protein